MQPIIDFFFDQYYGTPTYLIVLELLGVFFGFLSVICSKNNNILVYPTGIVSTAIFVYILAIYGLLGDMMINAYYFSMSIYGWYIWTRKVDPDHFTPITNTTPKENRQAVFIFIATMIFVFVIYEYFEKWNNWTAYVDTVTTAIFFVGMWQMAKKKIENWIFWIIGDLISVPLYFYKGLTFTAIQYFVFTIIAIYGYKAWKKNLRNDLRPALK